MTYDIIDPDKISDMLYNDSKYISEFCLAGVSSFEEFIENFRTHLLDRNMKNLRKAGHKIKPGAQMMGAHEVVEEYENAKSLLNREAARAELEKSISKMKKICRDVQEELSRLALANTNKT